ncbi:unnamed protein product [Clonostachys solani]|uniref:Flavin-containing monooxygenase n=1 Tax=Clonostachys solani TaxID=160281 RepID=A0A9N9ZHL5_9HYPO|nr:unnamed protein product [Clonostachys solani]
MSIGSSDKHTIKLPRVSAAGLKKGNQINLDRVHDVFENLNCALDSGDTDALKSLFCQDAWLRDLLTLSWDFRTIHGIDKIAEYINDNAKRLHLRNVWPRKSGAYTPSIEEPEPTAGVEWAETMIDFETDIGRGSGMVRLVTDDAGKNVIFALNLALQELKGHEDNIKERRPHGGNNSLKGGSMQGNWQERREREKEFNDAEPFVLVIGAGQAGLEIGARLGRLDVPTLIIDRNARIGDNWRNRYRTLVTHDPVNYCHMPYLPFPPNWPMFTPKDKLGDWFEAYASIMELNVWTSTTIESAEYSDETKSWTVRIIRGDGPVIILCPHHIILATGHSGEPLVPKFNGQDKFRGTVYHTSQHQDASHDPSVKGKKVVVVGSGNSGHDISQNFYENGADVTMLQRSGTYVIGVEKGVHMQHSGIYDETGPPTEDADIYDQSLPLPVQFALKVHQTARIAEAEKEELDGLRRAGFALNFGVDNSGVTRLYLCKGGGYSIDVGCTKLIIDGKIKVHQSVDGIREFDEAGLVLADGKRLDADVVVLATGYDNMRTTARKILGDKVANRLMDVWDLNDEGEVNVIWRYSGHPGFWYMGGNLALCRMYSKFLALQIKASKEGLYTLPI